MTTIDTITTKCPVCGRDVDQNFIMSTNAFGYADLDLRPPEMQRSTMYIMTSMCDCGNVFFGPEITGNKELVESKSYQSCDGIDFSRRGMMYYRLYLISKDQIDIEGEFFNLLRCAWACDDDEDENSVTVRKMAIEVLDEIMEFEEERDDNHILLKADLLRRSRQFDKLIEEFKDIKFEDETYQKIMDFQLEKANEEDDSCYTVGDAIGAERPY